MADMDTIYTVYQLVSFGIKDEMSYAASSGKTGHNLASYDLLDGTGGARYAGTYDT